jgi:hypothetical protein
MVDGLLERSPAAADFSFQKVGDVVVERESGTHIVMIFP